MSIPPLVQYETVEQYRAHFRRVYCQTPLSTFDNIEVRFRQDQFDHCFFESSRRDTTKDTFSRDRAERIDWIRATLQDANTERYVGWDAKRKRPDSKRRAAILEGDFVVVIRMLGSGRANFVTAFCAELATITQIRKGSPWKKKNR